VSKETAVALTAVVGGMIALQAPINSTLGKRIGTLPAASLSFAIGTILAASAGSARSATCSGTTCSAASSARRT
jgi:uncharacterized membrane protein YdcZ (DUF606 family)